MSTRNSFNMNKLDEVIDNIIVAVLEEAAKSKEYKEGPSSTFTHNKVRYSVDSAIERSKDIPTKKVAVSKLKWLMKYAKPNENRKRKADTSVPVLLAHHGEKLVVVDGLHRLAKAIEDGEKYLPTKLLTDDDLKAIKRATKSK